jgi:hypothetical protein
MRLTDCMEGEVIWECVTFGVSVAASPTAFISELLSGGASMAATHPWFLQKGGLCPIWHL